MPDDLKVALFAVIAAVFGAPVLGWLGAKLFPPEDYTNTGRASSSEELRYQIIEWSGVGFFLAGISVPFLLSRTNELQASLANITLLLALGFLFMVSGISILSTLLGDRKAQEFCKYFERKRGIDHRGVRKVAKLLVFCSCISLIILIIYDSLS